MCFHVVVPGLGMMGDALTCIKCGKSKYPEVFGWYWDKLPETSENLTLARLAIVKRGERGL